MGFFCDRLFLIKPTFANERFPPCLCVCKRESEKKRDLIDLEDVREVTDQSRKGLETVL